MGIKLEEIGKIKKPLVWRLADQWAFCGSEHYAQENTSNALSDSSQLRFTNGYSSKGKNLLQKIFDIDKLTWERKRKAWKKPINIVCTSNWMLNCVKQSS